MFSLTKWTDSEILAALDADRVGFGDFLVS